MPGDNRNEETLLVRLLSQGNETAFRALFDKYYQDIFGYSASFLKSRELAEENVQDVFLKIWMKRETLNENQSFKSFLFTIARNQAFNMLSKAANDAVLREQVFYQSQKSYDGLDYALRQADCEKLEREALKQLPPKREKIFEMSRKEGKSYEEISAELGISVQTVKNQMSKALESMRLFFKSRDGILILIASQCWMHLL